MHIKLDLAGLICSRLLKLATVTKVVTITSAKCLVENSIVDADVRLSC